MQTSSATSTHTRQVLSLVFNLAIVVLECIGLALSIQSHGVRLLEMYTEDSNILALISCALVVVFTTLDLCKGTHSVPQWVRTAKYAATCCLAVTLLVVLFILIPTAGENGWYTMLFAGSMLYHHLLCPVLAILSFLLLEGKPALSGRYALVALIPTILYALITTALNIARVMVGPYPFLRVYQQPVLLSVFWFVLIVGGAYLIAQGIRLLGGKFARGV